MGRGKEDTAFLELRQRSELIVEFCSEHFRSAADRDFMAQFGRLVEEAVENGDRRGLKMLYKELERLAENLAPADHLELQSRLSNQFGVDKDSEARADREAMSAILRRGSICTMDEYVLLRGLIDHEAPEGRISPDDEAHIVDLLSQYEAAM